MRNVIAIAVLATGLMLGCATTPRLTMEVIPEGEGVTVNIKENEQLLDHFRSDRDVVVVTNQDSTEEGKLVLFLDPTNIDGSRRSYYVGLDAFTDLKQYFEIKELSDLRGGEQP